MYLHTPALPEFPPARPALSSGIHGIKYTPTRSYKHTLPSPGIPGCIEQVTEIWVVGSYRCAYIRPMGRYQYMIYEGSTYRCYKSIEIQHHFEGHFRGQSNPLTQSG